MQEFQAPNAIRTQQREVTLLFADLRRFTELAGALHTDPLACELLTQVMDCLSEAVASNGGYIVDYFGDGLMAMWNAPCDQPHHAEHACRAALEMLASLPAVTEDWIILTQTELRLGIGIHTGAVQVGNAGSAKKVKYGPRGPNVNLASRVEAATKELNVPFLTTRSTADGLTSGFIANRVCRALLPGLQQPVDLYSVQRSPRDPLLEPAWRTYDKALCYFEQGDHDAAAELLATIDASIAEVPRQFLTERVQNELGRKRRRRNSDTPVSLPGGVIPLIARAPS
jgi:adenylate cyclase